MHIVYYFKKSSGLTVFLHASWAHHMLLLQERDWNSHELRFYYSLSQKNMFLKIWGIFRYFYRAQVTILVRDVTLKKFCPVIFMKIYEKSLVFCVNAWLLSRRVVIFFLSFSLDSALKKYFIFYIFKAQDLSLEVNWSRDPMFIGSRESVKTLRMQQFFCDAWGVFLDWCFSFAFH